MADQEITLADDDSSAASAPQPGLMGKIKIGAFVLAVVAVECVVAMLYLPSADDTKAMAQGLVAGQEPDDPNATPPEEETEEERVKRGEVPLGDAFQVTSHKPASNTTLRIDFSLYGIVLEDNADEFAELLEKNKHRYRDSVGQIMRSSEVTDFTDPGLGLLKRKILEKTNRIIGKPLLESVIFSDFSFIET
jgi:flagellar basal body-associated protein FliL